jgi:hypothetical protein
MCVCVFARIFIFEDSAAIIIAATTITIVTP